MKNVGCVLYASLGKDNIHRHLTPSPSSSSSSHSPASSPSSSPSTSPSNLAASLQPHFLSLSLTLIHILRSRSALLANMLLLMSTLHHLLPLFYMRKVLRINKRRRDNKKHRQSWRRWHRRLF